MRTDDDPELGKKENNKNNRTESINNNSKDSKEIEKKELGYWGLTMCVLLMLLLWLTCIGLRYIDFNFGSIECDLDDTDDNANVICKRQNAIYRVTSIITIFFVLHGILCLYNVEQIFDHYWLIIKFPIIVLICVGLIYFSFSNNFNNNLFVWWGRIGAFIFLIFQQIILLDFAYYWNFSWFNNHQSSNPLVRNYINSSDCNIICRSIWLLALLAIAFVLFAIFIAAMILLYDFYGGSHCTTSNTIITITLVGMLVAGALQLSTSNGSLMTTTILMIYVAYITYAAVSLNPNETCNPLANKENGNRYGIGPSIVGLFISFISIIYMSTITTRSISSFLATGDKNSFAQGRNSGSTSLDLKKKIKKSIFFINIVYAFLSLYLAMTTTNWGLRVRSLSIANPNTSEVAMWMQAVAAWISIALYIISLLYPTFNIIPTSIWEYNAVNSNVT